MGWEEGEEDRRGRDRGEKVWKGTREREDSEK